MIAESLDSTPFRINLLAAYHDWLVRAHTRRKKKIWRVSAFMFTYIGMVCLGVALAPIAPVIQWYAGMAAETARTLPRELTSRTAAKDTSKENDPDIAVGAMPLNADKPFILTRRQDALAVAGYAEEGAARSRELLQALQAVSQTAVSSSAPVSKALAQASSGKDEDWVSIPKIGVKMSIVTGEDGKRALLKGAWLIPDTSTPDRGGNTVLSCHRYLYTKGPLTCFNLDKLKEGDDMVVQWKGTQYHYRIRIGKVVSPKEISILNNSREPIVTIFTCTPVFTSKNRLYYVADLIQTKPVVKAALH